MSKNATLVMYIVLAMLAAGLFGALHDQISYAVSAEYFTRFKFPMFHLMNAEIPERVRAAAVGFLGSWWMGIPLGIFTGAAGFMHETPGQMRRALLLALPVIMCFTLAFALAGLAYGYTQTAAINLYNYAHWYIPVGVEDLRRYLCAGYMHNAAYVGGAFSIPVAWAFHIAYKRRVDRAAQ